MWRRHSDTPPPAIRGAVPWAYSTAEIWADGAVHALGVTSVLAASVILMFFLWGGAATPAEFAAVGVYVATLVTSLGVSAAYNLWPVSRTKWLLRRLDHSAIFLLIAGTYTPFAVKLGTFGLLAGVWLVAALGVALKLLAPGRYDRLTILVYVALGWSFVFAYEDVLMGLPEPVLWLTGVGGLLYMAGIVFHLLEGLKFHNAIWHGFVLLAAGIHFGAIATLLFLGGAAQAG
ncbi:MAG TPA: hemolysin III family protein [Mesorhizobium sp.]|nr:hemolysin III family protein [Mesorhizobium sp.]